MPIPVYLVCAESGAIDESTKLVSLFNIVEKVQISQLVAPRAGTIVTVKAHHLRIAAYWMKEDSDDAETIFECRIVGVFPSGPGELEFATAKFQFTQPFHKLTVLGVHLTQFFGPGILWIEARIRKDGEDEWISTMRYPIVLEEVASPDTSPADPVPPSMPPRPSRD